MKGKFNKNYFIIKNSGLFDEAYYLKHYDDVRRADIDPIEHYVLYGWKEGRNPAPWFDTKFYLENNQDVAQAGVNPFVHWIRWGRKEGRKPNSNEIQKDIKSFSEKDLSSLKFSNTIIKKENGELKGRRILIVTPEIYGPIKNGGIGTAFYELAKTLVFEGANVTILYALGYHSETEPIEFWKSFYEKLEINFLPLQAPEIVYISTPYSRHLSHKVDLWLQEREKEFDLVIFPDWMGLPFYVLSAKNQGLRYRNLPVIVNTHGPALWAYEGNYWLPSEIDFVDRDFMERKSISLADYVVSPSAYILKWMKERNWAIPKRERVIQNLFDKSIFEKFKKPQEFSEIKRLIFFGRLEPRKGIELFVKALERLPAEKKAIIEEIVFLGKPIHTENFDSLSYLEGLREKISVPFKLISLQRDNVLHYLSQQKNALVVVPSLIENSPYTVLELLNLGIPFIASKVGGIPELIKEEDRDRALFYPVPDALTQKLEEFIGRKGEKIRPSKTNSEVKREWLDFIKEVLLEKNLKKTITIEDVREYPLVSVCVTHYERPQLLKETLESLYRQTYKNFEIVVIDDGSKSKETIEFLNYLEAEFKTKDYKVVRQENRYLGSARNRGAKEAKGDLLLFMDDDDLAKSQMIETFVKSYLHTRAQVYTCFNAHFYEGEDPEKSNRIWLPLGEALGSGMFINVFGGANSLIEKRVFFEVGGFSEDYGIGYEDYEFFAKIVLKGFRLEVIPEVLYYYRVKKNSMSRSIDRFKSEARRVRPYIFMDEKGLGVGIGYALKLYLDTIYFKEKEKQMEVLWEDEYFRANRIFKKFWQKRWFKTLTKVAVKILERIDEHNKK